MRVERLLPRSISKRSLLDEIKAISIPEKNAENAMEMSICMISPIVVVQDVLFIGCCV